MIKLGVYRHYKGKNYQVLGIAKHSETLEEMVIYQALYGKKQIWVRPRKMFEEKIIIERKLVKRFCLEKEDEKNYS